MRLFDGIGTKVKAAPTTPAERTPIEFHATALMDR